MVLYCENCFFPSKVVEDQIKSPWLFVRSFPKLHCYKPVVFNVGEIAPQRAILGVVGTIL